jgi:hypothetical protein
MDASSVSAHQKICEAPFIAKIKARERNPVKLHFREAVLILKQGITINSRTESEEIQHL